VDGLVGAGLTAIGLTGGIGSGKSTVAQILVSCGAHLVDTDGIARAITQPGGLAIPDLVAAFGDGHAHPGRRAGSPEACVRWPLATRPARTGWKLSFTP
jgi:hypothetical protein